MSEELKKLPEAQVQEMLSAHRKWVDSEGKEGARAELIKVNLQKWNLCNARLEKSLLTGTDIQQSVLIGAQLQESELAQANLFGVNFEDANLRHANLRQANLKDTVLLRTNLRDADFQDAELLGAKGLQAGQLGGANLSGAQLPHYLQAFEGLAQVEELSKSAKKLFVSILLGCVYCWLTIFSTKDAQLLTNSSSTPLPIIQAPIPIAGFYGVAPFVLLSLFIYFHLYLQRLWRELAGLPAVFPDGKPLDEKAHPWLLNSLVRAHVPRLKINRPTLSRLEVGLSILLGWWLVPFTATLFWLRALQRHDWVLTGFQVVWAVTAILCATWFYKLVKRTLNGRQPTPIRFKGNWLKFAPYKETAKQFGVRTALAIFITFLLLVVSDGAINRREEVDSDNPRIDDLVNQCISFVPDVLLYVGARADADFTEQDVSTKPQNWFLRENVDLPRIVQGAQLQGADLRWAKAGRAFLMKADLREAKLQRAYLVEADLQHADLFVAKLDNANMVGAKLRHANLGNSELQHTSLAYAQLQEADLSGAELQNADLTGTNFQGANLARANMQGAYLYEAELQNAYLWAADLTGSRDLTQAQLDVACVNEKTKLPPGLKRPKPCPKKTPQ